ncbi:4-hydroxy-tetrahydrodipicolinate synthase [Parasediminibacterium sp. JCM 36343]|uniref:4-hydroxy-tetrahydrodipicolinate synthase n=1 Tax=Parasediminibacterium sp. JCM 36343 TaxID=3374279 RepID=UPI00397C756E
MSLRSILAGTGVALITPFKKDLTVDFNALEKTINYVIDGGVESLVTLGTTGETPTLSREERLDIIQFTYEKVKNRVPVVVGVGGNDTAGIIKDLETFPLDKATAILSTSPYYSKPTQEGLYQHFKALAAVSPKPLLLYNVPGRTGRNLRASTSIRLANEVENIAGIKEATDDMQQCMELIRDRPANFLVVSGDDALILPQIACGFDGVISVAANTFPKDFSSMVRLCLKGDFVAARAIHYKLLKGYDLLFEENNPAGVKAFMHEQGLIENILRLPLTPVSQELQETISEFLKTL